jgi:hypothetical protein
MGCGAQTSQRAGGVLCCPGTAAPAAGGGATPAGPPAPTRQEIQGHWSGHWGRLVLKEVNGQIRGVYSHDQGTIVGSYQEGVLRGWWCEAPSRKPSGDAGDVEFRFVKDAGGLRFDGRWRYGTTGGFNEDWDLKWTNEPIPPDLLARFNDPSAFCPHP